ncbi:hypothetical protein GTY20_39590 [Streptomyces sp. SID4946]|nr:hypothetical protein [Streptomyces sp. SID4946]
MFDVRENRQRRYTPPSQSRHPGGHDAPSGSAQCLHDPAIETWQKSFDGPGSATATFAEAVRETEEVVPVNVSTWVLSSGITVGR